MPRFATEEARREWAQDKAGDHSPAVETDWVCAYCDCVPVARQGDHCSQACADADREADREAADFRHGIDLLPVGDFDGR